MTRKQRKALEFLWFKYGNGGQCYTPQNHKYIQFLIAEKVEEAKRLAHIITRECKDAVERVMNDDYRELGEGARQVVEAAGAGVI